MPVPLVFELYMLGWCLCRFTRFKRVGAACKILAGCLFLLFGYGLGSTYIYRHERRFPPFEPDAVQREQMRGAVVAVLGQTFAEKTDLPVRYRANAAMNLRLQEGIRVSKLLPESQVLVSMSRQAKDADKNAFLDEAAALYAIGRDRLIMFTGAFDTADEARLIRERVGSKTLVLVTSAAHMPRAMVIFRKFGMTPLPAPCDYQMMNEHREWEWPKFPLPSGGGFECAEHAAYEWMGSLYEQIQTKDTVSYGIH